MYRSHIARHAASRTSIFFLCTSYEHRSDPLPPYVQCSFEKKISEIYGRPLSKDRNIYCLATSALDKVQILLATRSTGATTPKKERKKVSLSAAIELQGGWRSMYGSQGKEKRLYSTEEHSSSCTSMPSCTCMVSVSAGLLSRYGGVLVATSKEWASVCAARGGGVVCSAARES